MKGLLMAVMGLLCSQGLFCQVFHHSVSGPSVEWTVEDVEPFDELVVSWNGARCDDVAISVRVKLDEWSEELPYAVWGPNGQRTFTSASHVVKARTNEDTIEILDGLKARGFSVKIVSAGAIRSLHASCIDTKKFKEEIAKDIGWKGAESILLPVAGRSQLALKHPRNTSLCSPSSTAAVASFLSGQEYPTADFAAKVWDAGFDIYGNWIFNVAEAAAFLGKGWNVYMARYLSFEDIYRNLKLGRPTVVSVRGTLPGTVMPYSQGHLIAVIGYDKDQDCILCMDPAYPSDEETLVRYPRSEFLEACAKRGYIGYFFDRE